MKKDSANTFKFPTWWQALMLVFAAYLLATLSNSLLIISFTEIASDKMMLFFKTLFLSYLVFGVWFFYREKVTCILGAAAFPKPKCFVMCFQFSLVLFVVDFVFQTKVIDGAIHGNIIKNVELFFNFWWRSNPTILLFLVTIIIVPVSEEVAFRGVLQGAFRQSNIPSRFSILIISLIWTLDHADFFSYWGVVTTFFVGCSLGYIREKSGSVIPCIFVHSLINFFWFVTWLTYD